LKLKIKTRVEAPLEIVQKGFDQHLFQALNPPFPKVKVMKFDGSKPGDTVSLQLNFVFFKQLWTSEITAEEIREGYWHFVDQGVQLPFFLSQWKHIHRVEAVSANSSCIIDDITFSTGTLLTDLLFYPAMLAQFAYRIPVYKRYFAKLVRSS
jgi:ligand-binding SRPBCC domain-containing protein